MSSGDRVYEVYEVGETEGWVIRGEGGGGKGLGVVIKEQKFWRGRRLTTGKQNGLKFKPTDLIVVSK